MNIQSLEDRLRCLQEKYENITDELEEERQNGVISEESGNLPHLLAERIIILKQMDLTKAKIRGYERQRRKKMYEKVESGAEVKLENHTHCLEVLYVDDQNDFPHRTCVSSTSPIGKAMKGKRVGDRIEVKLPRGRTNYTITNIG